MGHTSFPSRVNINIAPVPGALPSGVVPSPRGQVPLFTLALREEKH